MLRRILNLAPEAAVAAAPAAAPAAPAPADTAAPLAGSSGEDIFAELDAMDKPAQPAAAAPAKPADKKPDDKPAQEPAKPADKPLDKNEPKAIKEMREALKRKDARETELSSKIADYERKIADYDKRGKDATALTERMATLEKQLDERQAEIRAIKYEASQEFQDKYEKPFSVAATNAQKTIEDLEIPTRDDAGNVTGARKATWNDFIGIYRLSQDSMGAAVKAAVKVFGESSQVAIAELQTLNNLNRAKAQAITDGRAKAKERADAETAEESKAKEWTSSTWTRINTDLAEKSPEVFQPDPKDKQRAELFTKSLALVDSRHNGTALTPIQRVTLDAQVRLRASAFPVLKYDLNKANDRIAELEAKLAEVNDSDPGKTQRAGGESTNQPAKKSFADELKELKI